MTLEVVPFADAHVADAVALLARTGEALRAREPALPPEWGDRDALTGAIEAGRTAGPAVAALRDGRLAGFMASTLDLGGAVADGSWPSTASLGGRRRATVRLTGHSADGDAAERREAYRAMYAALASRFLAAGCFAHAVTVATCDEDAVRTWFELGFGVDQVLGWRDTSPPAARGAEVIVRRAAEDDLDALVTLAVDLQRFHAEPPVLEAMFTDPPAARRTFERALDEPGGSVWIAVRGEEALGMMELAGGGQPSLNGGRSASGVTIGMASVAPSARLTGVGTAILARSLEWAREQGYADCTVGWASANLVSDRFWRARGFRPVHLKLARHVDERIAWANERMTDADLRGR